MTSLLRMEEEGKIIAMEGGLAKVAFPRKTACGKCGLCFRGSADMVVTEAENELGAQIGQRVRVILSTTSFIKSAAFVYLFPLFLLICGLFFGRWLADYLRREEATEVIAAISALFFLAGAFFLIRCYERRARRRKGCQSKIVEILK